MISFRQTILFIYSALLLIGGLMGFLKANSLSSLIFGGSFALLLALFTWYLERKGKLCLYTTVSLLLVLDLFFSYRFLQTFKFFPSGLFSIINFVIIIITLVSKKKKL